MITEVRERLNRLAIGAKMGAIELDTWHELAWFYVATLRTSLRHFIEVSEDHRAGRYWPLSEVADVFEKIASQRAVDRLEGSPGQRELSATRSPRVGVARAD